MGRASPHAGSVLATARHRFAAMGTRALVVVVGGEDLVRTAVRRVDDLEAKWSRFRADSEVSVLNRRAGCWSRVSADTYELVERACAGWRMSGGAFDPTILRSLESHGYDRSFELIGRVVAEPEQTAPAPGCSSIDLDPASSMVRLPRGVGFDPGGIGKGLAADLVAAEVVAAGADGVLISVGGDLVARGRPPTGAGWTVAVEEPTVSTDPIATVSFEQGAVATSVTTRRRWRSTDGDLHHLIDPATGNPHDQPPRLVTAVAHDGWIAEVAAKASMAPEPIAPALATVPALVLGADGKVDLRAGIEGYLS